MADKFDLKGAYVDWVERVKARSPQSKDAALKEAIGGEFEAFGAIERDMLIHYGLQKQHCVADVGCGSGRLTLPLSKWLTGAYIGSDVVPDLLDHAKRHADRPDWIFGLADGFKIAAEDETVDFVCFFSVFTHLLHEQTYLYLEDAKRVLKPGGRIIFSFLEFKMPFHWSVFEATVADTRGGNHHPLNVFISRDAVAAWAHHLGLTVHDIRNGDDPFVPLSHPVTIDSGDLKEDFGNLGQSICALEKPSNL
jgi:SAM-dependent methyltransferase